MKYLLVVFCFSCYVTLSCSYHQLWKPSIFTEHSANDSIRHGTHTFSDTVTNYVDRVKQRKEMFTKGVETLIKDTGRRINETVINYFKTMADFRNQMHKRVNVLNTGNKNRDKFDADMVLDAPQLIAKSGYQVEAHTVLTDDGYLLTLHRIPHAKNASVGHASGQAVILQHGILSSSVDFLTSGPKRGLAFVMAEAGYDVWLGNFRGNTYSGGHVKYTKSDTEFWNFTWHDIAMHDLPAMIDYVNAVKKSDKETLYIGHSMGNTALFALLSMKPQYNNKLKAAFCLAPVAYMSSLRSPLKIFTPFAGSLEWIRDNLGANEFSPHPAIMKWLAMGCDSHFYKEKICENIIFLLGGYDEAQLDKENLLNILSHAPAGTSTKTVIHFAQLIRDNGRFQQFDYGPENNMKAYHQKIPPAYPVSKITLPIALFVGNNDLLVGKSDSEKLYKDLPNAIELYEVPYEDFNHFDFLWAVDAQTLLYDHLLKVIDKFKTDQGVLWSNNPFFHLTWKVT